MNTFQKLQEKYIEEFNNNISIEEFILNILVTALLVSLLRWYYVKYGNAISNRQRFASNFLPLALATMLIIMIVKSSIALSLGLVGALSIVRFRAAIKDPEELTYLFFVIGLGLAGGANQPILAVVAFVFIIGLLFLHKLFVQKTPFNASDRLFVNIHTDTEDLEQVTKLLSSIFSYVELKRLDTMNPGMDLSFICKADNLDQLSKLKNEVIAISPKTKLSIIDQPDLIV